MILKNFLKHIKNNAKQAAIRIERTIQISFWIMAVMAVNSKDIGEFQRLIYELILKLEIGTFLKYDNYF